MLVRKLQKTHLKNFAFSVFLIGILSFLFIDQNLSQLVSTERHPHFYRPIRELTEFAEGKYYFAVIVFLLLTSGTALLLKKINILKDSKLEKMGLLFDWSKFAFLSMLCGGLILQLIKHLVGRQRPHVSPELDPHVFDFWTFNWHYHSFPSGHTQTVFTFAAVLWVTFPKINKFFFVIPLILSMTRLPLEEHFLSDVIGGAMLGFFSTLWVAKRFQRVDFV